MQQMKIILNQFSDPKLSECDYVGVGDIVYAHKSGEEFNLTTGKGYEILKIVHTDSVFIKNDLGEIDEYTVEYFRKNPPFEV